MMSEEQRAQFAKEVIEWNRQRLREHVAQQFAKAKQEGQLGILYGLTSEQLRMLMDRQSPDTLHGEDCVFLWQCGIRADQDLVPQGAVNGR